MEMIESNGMYGTEEITYGAAIIETAPEPEPETPDPEPETPEPGTTDPEPEGTEEPEAPEPDTEEPSDEGENNEHWWMPWYSNDEDDEDDGARAK